MEGRTILATVVLVVTICAIGSYSADPSIHLEADKETVEEGGDVTLTCTFHASILNRLIFWQKVTGTSDISDIAINGYVTPAYASEVPSMENAPNRRYYASLGHGDQEDMVVATLRITGAVLNDAGTIRCTVPYLNKFEETQIAVIESDSDVYMDLKVDNQKVEEGGNITLTCTAHAHTVIPLIKWRRYTHPSDISEIATNGYVDEAFANLVPFGGSPPSKRYHASIRLGDEEETVATLRIIGAVVDDSAIIMCIVPSHNKFESALVGVYESNYSLSGIEN